MLTQMRHKIAWMYVVEAARPVESWAEHGAIVDAVARGDAERARALTVLHADRAAGAHRPRLRPAVRTSQPVVNMSSGRH